MKLPRLLSLVCLAISSSPVLAQSQVPAFDPSRAAANALRGDASALPALRDQQTRMRNVITDENIFAPETPGDPDIGQQLILKRNEKTEAFAVMLDSGYFFTDNVAQIPRGARDDFFYVGGGGVSWQPRITRRIYGNFSVAQHWYEYDQYSVLDYQSGEAIAGAIILMPEVWNTIWYVNYYHQRITQEIGDDAIYQTHNVNAGVQKTLLFDRKNSVNLGLLASLALDASPSELKRNEYFASASWNYRIKHSMQLSLSYRLICYDYQNFDGRRDWSNNFGVTFVYRPRDWMELAASWNYTINDSNKEAFNYDVQLAGPSVSVRMKF